MLNFKSAGVQDGTFDQAAASGQPPRPPGIPEHYIFDTEVELWMPPSAIAKARSRCVPLPSALLLLHRLHGARPLDVSQSAAQRSPLSALLRRRRRRRRRPRARPVTRASRSSRAAAEGPCRTPPRRRTQSVSSTSTPASAAACSEARPTPLRALPQGAHSEQGSHSPMGVHWPATA